MQADALAYGVGYYLGEEVRIGLESDGVEVNLDRLAAAFSDGLMNREPAMSREELDAVLVLVDQEMRERQAKRLLETDPKFRELAERNAERSRMHVTGVSQREGVRELFDGVFVETLASGEGQSAEGASKVVLTFEARTLGGKVFLAGNTQEIDPAKMRETPRRILAQMRVGDQWVVTLAPEAAYGLMGHPPDVGPNEAVVIDVALLEVR
jgi:FKBP-type peptidyl-prolyl cis-trans isomerase